MDHRHPSRPEHRSHRGDDDRSRRRRGFLARWFAANSVLAGGFAVVWLLLRSAPRPSRLAYPCQQAALTTAALAFSAPFAAALAAARHGLTSGLRRPAAVAAAVVGVVLVAMALGGLDRVGAVPVAPLDPPDGYRAQVFHVSSCPHDRVGDRFPGLDRLLELMGRNGLKLYQTPGLSPLGSPEGVIGVDDVVVIKINYQWNARGGTNTDLLRGLIRAIADHPRGFQGEVVVCENSQFRSIAGFDRDSNNAEDPEQSPHAVVVGFQNQGLRISHYDWTAIRYDLVREFSEGDADDGYIRLPYAPGGVVTYPKFHTDHGTAISLREGIWDPVGETYDRDRLKFINLPVLKSHGAVYGVTGCVKNFMGVVSDGLADSHGAVRNGLMGAVMATIRPPDLNILDCIWINADPNDGPGTGYADATRADQLVASVDPVAADIWATRNILIPAFFANGHTPPWPHPSADPDDPRSEFRVYLDNSMNLLLAGGYAVTNNPAAIDVVTWDASRRLSSTRMPRGRVSP